MLCDAFYIGNNEKGAVIIDGYTSINLRTVMSSYCFASNVKNLIRLFINPLVLENVLYYNSLNK